MATVRITINGLDAFVRSPYEARMVIREMPDRTWNPALKVWIIPASDVDLLKGKLEDEGFAVQVADDTPKQSQQATANEAEMRHLRDRVEVLQGRVRSLEAENTKLRAENRVHAFNDRFGNSSPFSRRGSGSSWADDMFNAMSPALAEKVYKKLSTVLHPDLGGDTELMKLINVAHDKSKAA